MYSVIIESKTEKTSYIMATGLTAQEAESLCDSWGWTYDNGKEAFWMSIEEVGTPAFDYLKRAILDSKFETIEDSIDAIQNYYKRELITQKQRVELLKL